METKYIAWAAVGISALGLYLYFVEKRCKKAEESTKASFDSQREVLPEFGKPIILK